jgi:hypothetical protein
MLSKHQKPSGFSTGMYLAHGLQCSHLGCYSLALSFGFSKEVNGLGDYMLRAVKPAWQQV